MTVAAGHPSPASAPPRRGRISLAFTAVGLLAALILLAVHVRAYAFLTDDAFISFRYARNLAHGHGLVFNPGQERVEGYSNFLWVLMLAGLDALRLAPEAAANALSIAATLALWALVLRFCLLRPPAPRREWLLLLPAFGLAATRSFAVWATSGLETRWFELLVFAGLYRLVIELKDPAAPPRRALAPWLFALATWTRPDGLLVSACAALAASLHVAGRGRQALGRFLMGWAPYVVLVAAQLVFRRAYYHAWLPNTYYAKVGGHLWWDAGLRYLGAFALEYAAFLWLPLLAAAVVAHRRDRTLFVPALFASVIVPHALYVAAIGGDHFEYRPLDLYLAPLFVLMHDGARLLAARRWAAWGTALYLGLVAAGLVLLPLESHRQFPPRYISGFPGQALDTFAEARDYLAPEHAPALERLGLGGLARAHRDLVRYLTYRFVAIRQEEHRLFLESARAEARRIQGLVARGLLPADAYIAIDCVGVIPYQTGLPTLDRLGLTDARVAHSGFTHELMAHAKSATLEYAGERGVDLWAADPMRLICHLTSNRLMISTIQALAAGTPYYAAEIGGDDFVVAALPRGQDAARRRMPGLDFRSLSDDAFLRGLLARIAGAYRDSLRANPDNLQAAWNLAHVLGLAGDNPAALRVYQDLAVRAPEDVSVLEDMARCQTALGNRSGADSTLARALVLARRIGDGDAVRRIEERRSR